MYVCLCVVVSHVWFPTGSSRRTGGSPCHAFWLPPSNVTYAQRFDYFKALAGAMVALWCCLDGEADMHDFTTSLLPAVVHKHSTLLGLKANPQGPNANEFVMLHHYT